MATRHCPPLLPTICTAYVVRCTGPSAQACAGKFNPEAKTIIWIQRRGFDIDALCLLGKKRRIGFPSFRLHSPKGMCWFPTEIKQLLNSEVQDYRAVCLSSDIVQNMTRAEELLSCVLPTCRIEPFVFFVQKHVIQIAQVMSTIILIFSVCHISGNKTSFIFPFRFPFRVLVACTRAGSHRQKAWCNLRHQHVISSSVVVKLAHACAAVDRLLEGSCVAVNV